MKKKKIESKKEKKEPMKIFPVYLENDVREKGLEKSKGLKKSFASVIRELVNNWLAV